MSSKKVLISSANSYGNVGDDICGYSAEHLMKKAFPGADTRVTCPPYRKDLVDWSDAVVIGGGGVIYDSDFDNVTNYMNYVDEAKRQGKLAYVLGVGIQGIGTDKGRAAYQRSLGSADVVTVRTPTDNKLLKDAGVTTAVTTQDIGFATAEWVGRPSFFQKIRLQRLFKPNGKPNLGLALVDLVKIKGDAFDEKSKNFVDSVDRNLSRICQEFNVYLLVHSADDAEFYAQLKAKYDVRIVNYKTIKDIEFFWAAYKRLDLVIGSRFHSIVLACLAGVPVVGVSSESTKQNRLANYDMPTLLSQRLVFSDLEAVRDLFDNLYVNYTNGKYKVASTDEVERAKRRAIDENITLIKKNA